ncbi:MAG: DMT family transporter [Chlorobi bacterium]|nr:DMT family transporter [Chlorobiota bacterium]MCI0716322.1 DMT family transporter [Chlorobiota bacterium]
MTRLKAELLLFFVATIWAGTFPIVKVSMLTIPPFYFIGIRFLLGAVLFTVIFFNKLQLKDSNILKAGLVLGFFQMVGFGSQTIGMIYTSASNSALITGITILIVPFAQFLIIKKPVLFENWIGVLIVTIGLFLLTQPHLNGINIGDLITLICPFAWAFYIIYVDVYTNKYDIETLIFLQLWFVTLVSFALGFILEDFSLINFTANDLLSFLYMGILATFLTTILLNKYQKMTSPIRASIIYTWEQPAAVMFSVIFINEYFNYLQIIGGVLMIGGILFSETFEYIKNYVLKKSAVNK